MLLQALQNPTLTPGQTAALLADLALRYGRFRQTLQSVERLIAGDLAGS